MKKLILMLVLGCSISANLHASISLTDYHLSDTMTVEKMTDLVIGVAADFLEISAESISGDSNVAELCSNNQSTQATLIVKWGQLIQGEPLNITEFMGYETIDQVAGQLFVIYGEMGP